MALKNILNKPHANEEIMFGNLQKQTNLIKPKNFNSKGLFSGLKVSRKIFSFFY